MSKNKKLIRFLWPVILAVTAWSSAQAGLYKCTDAHHKIVYQDKPCQDMASAKLPGSLSRMAGREEERAFLWKAVSDKGVLYLLGSLHFGNPLMYPLPQYVMDSYTGANVLVVEVDINNTGAKEVAKLLGDRGHYGDKSSLEDHIKPTTWAKTVAMAKKLEIDEDRLRSLKPWLAALTLSSKSLEQAGYTADQGVDQVFIRESQGKKPVMELESLEEQVKLFDEFSEQEQEQMLLQTLQDLSRGQDLYNNIADAWKSGDAEAMDLITRQGYDSGPVGSKLFKAFFADRNERMVNRLYELAADGRTYFVVVGAGHLPGEQGMLKLLEEKGYKISQP
ncbi:MAG: TraB/GumN family protein [Methylococcaceae bacterium]|nr:TraB/GumN family protein [Methylococcaceae bacterium]